MTRQVVVIGAGAAGIAAARHLLAQGVNVHVMEAAPHAGGRCITDHNRLGHPFDLGGSWVHSAAVNPMAPLAQAAGAAIIEDDPGALRAVFARGRRLSEHELDGYVQSWRALLRMEVAEASDSDPALAAYVPDTPWGPYVRHVISLLTGVDADGASSLDLSRAETAPGEWLLPAGQGSLLAQQADALPIAFENPVNHVDYGADPIRVHTQRGAVEADAVIVTVSTAILREQRITFDPPLPDAVENALAGLPLGLLNKVGIAVRPDSPLAAPGPVLIHHASVDEAIMLRPGFAGHPVVCGFAGGRYAEALEAAGEGALAAACVDALCALYGHAIKRDLGRQLETAWRRHPWSLGAYSTALPGHADARAVLASGVDQRLLFAGEATDPSLFSTVGGAWRSGVRAAEQYIETHGKWSVPA